MTDEPGKTIPENTTIPPAPKLPEKFIYTSRKGKIHEFVSQEKLDAYKAKMGRATEHLRKVGLGNRKKRDGKDITPIVSRHENGEGEGVNMNKLTNEEEKKRLELEKSKKDEEIETATKKEQDQRTQQTAIAIAILIASLILVVVFFVGPKFFRKKEEADVTGNQVAG